MFDMARHVSKIIDIMSNNLVTENLPVGRMSASFEERSAWVQLFSLLVVLVGYALVAWQMWSNGVTFLPAYAMVFAVGVVLLVTVLIVGHIAAAIMSRPEGRDERDRLIGWRAESHASWLLGVCVLGSLGCMVMSVPPVLTAHLLLLSMFLSELLKLVLQIVFYRRGL